MNRVLFLPRWYPAENDWQNGVFIQKHARAAALQNEVVVLYAVPAESEARTETVTNGNLTEITVYYKTSVIKPLNILLYMRALFRGWSTVRQSGFFPDVCHVHVLNRPALLALRLRLMRGIPFIISEHWSGYITGGFEQRGLASGLFTAYAVQKAKVVTVVSEVLKTGMQRCGLTADYHIIPNVVEVLPNAQQAEPPNDTFRYLMVADLRDDIKYISGVIRAFKQVQATDKQTELIIAGDGPDRRTLEEFAAKEEVPVIFKGRLTNEQVQQLIPTAHAVLINSRIETFSVVTLESIFSGRPVISTRCGGPEQFVNEQNGILIDKDNDVQLAEAMLQLKKNYSDYPAEKVKSSVQNNFSLEKVGAALTDLYNGIRK